MFELQCLNNEDFYYRFRSKSNYYSDRTKVLVLNDKFRKFLPSDVEVFERSGENLFVSFNIKSNCFVSVNLDLLCKAYLDFFNLGYYSFDFTVINKLYDLVNQKVVYGDDYFNKIFSSYSETMKISDLACFNKIHKINKKNFSFKDLKDITVIDLVNNPLVNVKEMSTVKLNVLGTYNEEDSHRRKRFCVYGQYKNSDGDLQDLSFFTYKRTLRTLSQFIEKKEISIILDSNGNFNSFAPNGLNITKNELVSPSKNAKKLLKSLDIKLPVAAFRIIYYEYNLRKLLSQG